SINECEWLPLTLLTSRGGTRTTHPARSQAAAAAFFGRFPTVVFVVFGFLHLFQRSGDVFLPSGRPVPETGLHPDRAVGRDRHHRDPHRTAPAGGPEGPRGRGRGLVQ